MASIGNKDPIGNLREKLRAFFGFNGEKNKTAPPAKARFKVWHIILAALFFSYLSPLFFSSKTETISYSQFKQYIDQGIAGELVIGPDNIKGILAETPNKAFTTVRVTDPDLVKDLKERNVGYAGRYENNRD